MKILQLISAVSILLITAQAFAGGSLLPAPKGADKAAAQQISNGIKAKQKGDMDAALSSFKKAVKIDPKIAEAHFNLAMTLHLMGNHSEASKHFKHARNLGENNPAIMNSKTLQGHTGS